METSALDSTNVEAAFNEVLSGRCLLPRAPPPGGSLIYLLILMTSSHPKEGGQPAGDPRLHQRRHLVQPHWSQWHPGEEGGLLQELLTDRCRGLDLLPPTMGVMVSSRNYFTGKKITILTISLHRMHSVLGALVQTQSSRAAFQQGFVACQAHTAFPTFLSEIIVCLVGLKTRLDSSPRGSDLDATGWDEFWKKLFSWQELNYTLN